MIFTGAEIGKRPEQDVDALVTDEPPEEDDRLFPFDARKLTEDLAAVWIAYHRGATEGISSECFTHRYHTIR